jgi:cyclopropane-fatty-acyl-phospholipid synthase
MRRPNLETLANLWMTRRIDVRNGTVFDLARIRPKVRTREFIRTLDKRLLVSTLAKFLLVARGGPWPLSDRSADSPSDGSAEQNKENVSYHYDVSNAFYSLWLDQEMVYTCAYCTDWNNDIDRMQQDKLEMICRKLRLRPGERLLDIGCGWGALSCYAARHYGVHAYAVTLSEQQVAYGREKVRRLGLQDRVTIELKDYASVEGTFDKVAAIGIQEHIGIDNYPKYYATVRRVLKDDGLFLHHAIVRPAKHDDRRVRRKRPEFALLTKYIFPGGELDHIGNTVTMLERSGFEVHDVENWREHYQRTCRLWHDRLLDRYDASVRNREVERECGWRISLASPSRSSATRRSCSRRWRRSASAVPPGCRRRARTSIADRGVRRCLKSCPMQSRSSKSIRYPCSISRSHGRSRSSGEPRSMPTLRGHVVSDRSFGTAKSC